MPYKLDMLKAADKDLICEYVYRSNHRVMNKTTEDWNQPIPQGVSVFLAHPDKGTIEYLFTKDDKYPVVRDNINVVEPLLMEFGDFENGGCILYMNACMMRVASKHQAHSY